MLLTEIALTGLIGALALALVIVGYWSVGGPLREAIDAARDVAGRASSFARRESLDSGSVEISIVTPEVGTYRDADWLVVAECKTAHVEPRQSVVRSAGTPARLKLRVTSPTTRNPVIELAIYDLATMQPAGRLTVQLPGLKGPSKVKWLHRGDDANAHNA